jgi:hypothetical protein
MRSLIARFQHPVRKLNHRGEQEAVPRPHQPPDVVALLQQGVNVIKLFSFVADDEAK